MTFQEFALNRLINGGFFPNQAQQVLEQIEAAQENESMRDRWDDSMEGYPEQIKATLSMSVDDHAVKWIDQNLPKAWYRPIFAH